jgi:alpha-L-fucosidase
MKVKLKHFLWASAAMIMFGGCAGIPPRPAALSEPLPTERKVAAGRFAPTWESLSGNYQCPEWFRDAKLGFWAHWSAQCVPGQGDWYARNMYIQGNRQNTYHVAHYGHPTEFGFMEINHLWRAEKWEPEELMDLFIAAGAKYFVAMANHEDNFDMYDSRYHAWNSVNVGPKQDIVGTWGKVARKRGLRFGVSNHSSHTWHWFQTAYGYDVEGPLAGVRYDASRLKKEDGRGKWWEGLDPQDLYGKPTYVIPEGFTSKTNARDWHDKANAWNEAPPTNNPAFVYNWFFRLQDLLDRYEPDFLYLDNTGLPLGQAGLDIAAHYYNSNMARHGGKLEAVLTSKRLKDDQNRAMVQDWERNVPNDIQALPFAADTCIGEWHYREGIEYKKVGHVVRSLVDIVSKNGTMMLNIPQRGDGSIDEREVAFLRGLAKWIQVNGSAIYGTRPWHRFGEGPTKVPRGRAADKELPYTQEDIRFTTKDGALYAFVMALPNAAITIESLGSNAEQVRPVKSIQLLGSKEPVRWTQAQDTLKIERPDHFPSEDVIAFKITFD